MIDRKIEALAHIIDRISPGCIGVEWDDWLAGDGSFSELEEELEISIEEAKEHARRCDDWICYYVLKAALTVARAKEGKVSVPKAISSVVRVLGSEEWEECSGDGSLIFGAPTRHRFQE